MKTLSFDNIVAMNLLGLGVLSCGLGLKSVSEIPTMTKAIAESGKKLKPMPEVIEFTNALEVAVKE